MDFELSATELALFDEQGWIGPYRLLPPAQANELASELQRLHAQTRGYFYPPDVVEGDCFYRSETWFQSLHALSGELRALGRRPEVVERVAQLLGPDLMMWGAICFEQSPRERLHWHTDTEYDYWSGVSVWMGARGVTPRNALKILPGSHRYARTPEFFQQEMGLSMDDLSLDGPVLDRVRGWQPDAEMIRAPVGEGEFILFNGKLWHASDNPDPEERVALGLRYATPDQHVRIPLTYLHPVIWDPTPAPCMMVRGEDRSGVNRMLE